MTDMDSLRPRLHKEDIDMIVRIANYAVSSSYADYRQYADSDRWFVDVFRRLNHFGLVDASTVTVTPWRGSVRRSGTYISVVLTPEGWDVVKGVDPELYDLGCPYF